MHWYHLTALTALGICIVACLAHFIRLLRHAKPVDYSKPSGKTGPAILYSFTGAMSPAKKESAFLHLPTYSAGLLYHLGTFLSLLLFFFIISGLIPQGWLATAISAFLCVSSVSGLAILVKRMIKKELRSLSNPDDFISNFLVTLFQIITLLFIILPTVQQSNRPTVQLSNSPTVQLLYYLIFTMLMLYIPVGKLRHTVYFFAARYHLGYFYGWRGIWPPGKVNN